jgi:hypothetical protein
MDVIGCYLGHACRPKVMLLLQGIARGGSGSCVVCLSLIGSFRLSWFVMSHRDSWAYADVPSALMIGRRHIRFVSLAFVFIHVFALCMLTTTRVWRGRLIFIDGVHISSWAKASLSLLSVRHISINNSCSHLFSSRHLPRYPSRCSSLCFQLVVVTTLDVVASYDTAISFF